MRAQFRPAIVSFVVFTLLTGVAYPLVVTGVGRIAFGHQAEGSFLLSGPSILIGQSFDDPKYFWSRLSTTSPGPYNAAASSGSNLGPTNPALTDAANARIKALRAADPENAQPVPVDLVTASASGLDPHITPAAAQYQVSRIARVRGLNPAVVLDLLSRHTEGRQLGFLGEPRVNVLQLNLELDDLQRSFEATPLTASGYH
jgi:K+-transporting ATPase ATPase C chain